MFTSQTDQKCTEFLFSATVRCANSSYTGIHCNISISPCDTYKPCQNNGTCVNTNTSSTGYYCLCLSGFAGNNCQIDVRPCKPTTCYHNGNYSTFILPSAKSHLYIRSSLGTCIELSNKTFVCVCEMGWEGTHCEAFVNYCQNDTCMNNGTCEALFLNYTCHCPTSFYGRQCQISFTPAPSNTSSNR